MSTMRGTWSGYIRISENLNNCVIVVNILQVGVCTYVEMHTEKYFTKSEPGRDNMCTYLLASR